MAEEQENQTKKESGGSKLLLIVIVVLLLVLLIVGGLVAYFLLNEESNKKQAEPQKVETEKKVSTITEIGAIYPLDVFIVNLLSNDSNRYLKCKIDLELDSPRVQEEISKKLPVIRDLTIGVLSSKTIEEIQTLKGKDKLKREIRKKINEILTKGEIKNVYFTKFVIQ